MATAINAVKNAYPIRTVSALTGINAVTLRTWERRYHLIEPIRTPKGHRLYSKDQIAMLNRVVSLLESGMAISQINFSHIADEHSPLSQEQEFWSRLIGRMVTAVSRFNEAVLEAAYNEALSLYSIETVTDKLLMPILEILGQRWEQTNSQQSKQIAGKQANGKSANAQQTSSTVAEEHFFGVYLRNKLGARFHHRKRLDHGPSLITACLPGEHHEAGILLFSLSAYDHGYRCILLGANMPLEGLPGAVLEAQAQAIVLSSSCVPDTYWLKTSLQALVRQVKVPVFVGGQTSVLHSKLILESGAVPLGTEIDHSFRCIADTLKHQFANS